MTIQKFREKLLNIYGLKVNTKASTALFLCSLRDQPIFGSNLYYTKNKYSKNFKWNSKYIFYTTIISNAKPTLLVILSSTRDQRVFKGSTVT